MIRPLNKGDLPAVARVIAATDLFPPEMLDAMAAPYLAGGSDEAWLVADDGEPIAVAYLAPERMTQGTWNLLLIAVRPDRQGRGVGAALQRRVEDELAARGSRVLLVETSGLPSFERTRGFYERLGYVREARIRDFYEAGNDKIVFSKHLGYRVRPSTIAEVEALQAIERDAARAYEADPATRFCVALPVRDEAEHARAREGGLSLVGEVDGAPVSFLLAVPRDRCAHLLELAVARSHQGRGFGRRLIAAFETWAAAEGFGQATLTTFRDVPWNAPFYARLRYEAFRPEGDQPDLLALIAEEMAAGFHQAPRVAMRKRLPAKQGLQAS